MVMFDLFSKRKSSSGPSALRLISIHIPKTAGTSFRNTLCGVYGKDSVIRLDIGLDRDETRINEQIYTKSTLPDETQVVHGHFAYPALTERFLTDPSTPVITWLRHPVDRVVSNYFYLAKRLAEELREEEKGLHILSKLQRSLLEYAQQEQARNRMSKFLREMPLEKFRFVGFVEDYDNDLARLAASLDWRDYPVFKHNRTGKDTSTVSDDELQRIREWNMEDVALYERALQMKEAGYWNP